MSSALVSDLVMVAGFVLTAYAIITNNMPQTLGSFIASNAGRPWWLLWAFASAVLLGVVLYGWVANAGDVCYGRLDAIPLPERYLWIHLIPPLVLLGLTRFGVPVSPTFLIVPAFATAALSPMLRNAAVGYLAGLAIGLALYGVLYRLERHFIATAAVAPARFWIGLQLLATGLLWSQWLIQNLANVFAYVPRRLTPIELALMAATLVALVALILRARGGGTQRIVTGKTNLGDIRSATLLDLLYGLLLLAFLWTSRVPMSTTWVFLGTIGGRELALSWPRGAALRANAFRMLGHELGLALIGLGLSVVLALVLPTLHRSIDRSFNVDGDVVAAAPR